MPDRVKEKLVELLMDSETEDIPNNDGFYVCHLDRYKAESYADYLIAHGVTVQEWISVKDRLPDLELSNAKANDMDLFPCLCVIQHKRAKNGRYVTKLWYTGEGFIDGNNVYCDEVTHWMPIPQPPKGE